MYRIVPLSQVDPADWDAFVDSSDEAWLWHRTDLINALSIWPGRIDYSFAVLDRTTSEILAILPLHLIRNSWLKMFFVRTLNSVGGPAVKNDLGPKTVQNISAAIKNKIMEIAEKEAVMQADFSLSPLAPAYCSDNPPAVNPLLHLGFANTLSQVYMLDLRSGKDKTWENMEKRARNAIRKAENSKVVVRPANQTDDQQKYYRLHEDTYRRTGVIPHPKEYFNRIWRDFYSKGYAYILFAEIDGEEVAAENFGVYKKRAIYWTSASSSRGLETNASSLLQWKAIQHFIGSRFEFYESGEGFPGAIEGKTRGLDLFKRSFGGQLRPYFKGRLISRKRLYTFFKLFNACRGKD